MNLKRIIIIFFAAMFAGLTYFVREKVASVPGSHERFQKMLETSLYVSEEMYTDLLFMVPLCFFFLTLGGAFLMERNYFILGGFFMLLPVLGYASILVI